MKPKRGRPRKPDEQKRQNVLRVCLTEDERLLLDRAAMAKGLDLSAWVRSELITRAKELLDG